MKNYLHLLTGLSAFLISCSLVKRGKLVVNYNVVAAEGGNLNAGKYPLQLCYSVWASDIT